MPIYAILILLTAVFTCSCVSSPQYFPSAQTTASETETITVTVYPGEDQGNLFRFPVGTAPLESFKPVPLHKLSNYQSLKKKLTDAEFQEAYDIALQLVSPLSGLPQEKQLIGVAQVLRKIYDKNVQYSTSTKHYNNPYGYLVTGVASCAGSTRTAGLCLNILGIQYEHINENKWKHQWCRVNIDGGYWICDPIGLYVGPEPGPYKHPIFN